MTERLGHKVTWFAEAEKHIGLKESINGMSNPLVVRMWEAKDKWLGNDARRVPWCGCFVQFCLNNVGIKDTPATYYRAKSWSTYGSRLLPSRLAVGAILVFDRKGGGHVGFYAGEDATAYYVLGGNQSDSVRFSWIDKSRLTASRWPKGEPVIGGRVIRKRDGSLSTNEA